MAGINRFSVSVGRALPGMQAIGRSASSNIKPSSQLVELISEASQENGCVKVEIDAEKLMGKKMFRIKVAERPWEEKLDELASKVDDVNPALFVLFRGQKDVLFIKYIPDNAKTRTKMIYASTTGSVKELIAIQGAETRIEEYNVTTKDELKYAEYKRRQDIEAPLTEMEIQRKEEDAQETGGGYSLLARIMNSNGTSPVALPGMASKGPMPKFLRPPSDEADEDEEDDGENRDASNEADESEQNADEEDAAEEEPVRRSSSRSSRKSKSKSKRLSKAAAAAIAAEMEAKAEAQEEEEAEEAEEEEEEEEEEEDQYPYTLEDLVKMKGLDEYDDNMDRLTLEVYLTTKEFKKAFGMSKDAFAALPGWKKTTQRKKVGLF